MAKIQKSFVFVAFDATLNATKNAQNLFCVAKNVAKRKEPN